MAGTVPVCTAGARGESRVPCESYSIMGTSKGMAMQRAGAIMKTSTMRCPSVLAFVLAGGEGTRLRPLTAEHAKPALPLARGRRIVDFVLSNLVHSGIAPIYVIVQYKPRSLVGHIESIWQDAPGRTEPSISVLLPDRAGRGEEFAGTADAVYQNLDLVRQHRPDVVAVFAADHVYRMDVRQMVDFHEHCDADVTIATVRVPLGEASSFGVLAADGEGVVHDFQEKPAHALATLDHPGQACASMGNYLFRPEALIDLLEDARRRSGTDFGRHVLPRSLQTHRVLAYDLATNVVPGLQCHEERTYWRDVGTREALEAARRDVEGRMPRFDLDNPEWPIWHAPGPGSLCRDVEDDEAGDLLSNAVSICSLPPVAAEPRLGQRPGVPGPQECVHAVDHRDPVRVGHRDAIHADNIDVSTACSQTSKPLPPRVEFPRGVRTTHCADRV